MRAIRVTPVAEPVRVFDLSVSDHHTVALSNGVVVSNCDTRCYGKACGTCNYEDLKIRTGYIRAAASDRVIDLSAIRPVDQSSQAMRIRARIHKPEQYRFVGNDHWRFNFRRAAFRAQTQLGTRHGISKRSIRFASDEVKYRDWTAGTDYVEFSMTLPMVTAQIQAFVDVMNEHLTPWMSVGQWATHPTKAVTMRTDVDLVLFELEIDDDYARVLNQLKRWSAGHYVPMRLKIEGGYFAPASEEVNAHDYVDDLWVTRAGHRLKLRMLLRGRPNPYNVYAAVMGKPSWLEAAKLPAMRLDAFVQTDRSQQDFLRPSCLGCGLLIPVNILDQPYDPQRCPRCRDTHDGTLVKELTF